MTLLAVPIPSKSEKAVSVVPWREVFYPIAFGVWTVVNVAFLYVDWPRLVEISIFVVPLVLLILDLLVRPGALDIEPPEPTVTYVRCYACGGQVTRQDARYDDGVLCPTCPPQPVSPELVFWQSRSATAPHESAGSEVA